MIEDPEKFETDAIGASTPEAESLSLGEREASKSIPSNKFFRQMMDRNFLEYASYVVKDRAIPDVDDGLKPVQRRILWAMHLADDGRTHKAAAVVGDVMGKFHPHGDMSIKDALVVLANKDYFIEKQGNFGNIITGKPAAASRYIECGLSTLGREVLFNDALTPLVDTYDSQNKEPVVLPVKIPALLLLGTDGIAVGMSTKIPPHNFNELLLAQISCLKKEPFTLYPDFQQGGFMDVRDYRDGEGKITLRAKIDIDGRRLVIREIPATTTTESLVASVERAAEKNKIKIASISDYTARNVEIEIIPTRGYDPEKTRQALYMYTDCSISITPRLTVIRDRRPAVMTVTEIIERNTQKLLVYMQKELENSLDKQNDLFHAKTLAQIFFENRIYKRIEESKSEAEEYHEVHSGLAPYRDRLRRDITNDDVDKLLALPVRRISRFDIEKNQTELREIDHKIAEIKENLAHLVDYSIKYLQDLLDKYGKDYPRRTEIENLEKIDRSKAALNNIKIGWDRRSGYIGSAIKSEDVITCNEYDKLLLVRKDGGYKVTELPGNKEFVDKLFECRKHDATQVFGVIYRENKSGKYYAKRTVIDKFITDKEYNLCPAGCKIELLATRTDAIWLLKEKTKRAVKKQELNLMTLPMRAPRARGLLITTNQIEKLSQVRLLTSEELELFARQEISTVALEEPVDPAGFACNLPQGEVRAETCTETTTVIENIVIEEAVTVVKCAPEIGCTETTSSTRIEETIVLEEKTEATKIPAKSVREKKSPKKSELKPANKPAKATSGKNHPAAIAEGAVIEAKAEDAAAPPAISSKKEITPAPNLAPPPKRPRNMEPSPLPVTTVAPCNQPKPSPPPVDQERPPVPQPKPDSQRQASTPQAKKAKVKPAANDNDSDDDENGIIQPELFF